MAEAISVQETLKAYKKYETVLPTLPTTDAAVVLSTLEPIIGVKGSIELTSVLINGISKKYNGKFDGANKLADLEHRTLQTGVITPEIAHEPENLRSLYLADVMKLKLNVNETPFERWLLEWGILAASQDLDNAIYKAKVADEDTTITGTFNSFEEIIKADITATKISTQLGNYADLGAAISAANAGDKLLSMYRGADKKLKSAPVIEMRISQDVREMYDDWYKTTHDRLPNIDTSGQTILEGSQGKVKLISHSEWPAQRVVLTIPRNMCYGVESLDQMKKILPFESGNPHLYTATGKYNFGVQFRSIHKSVFRTNKLY